MSENIMHQASERRSLPASLQSARPAPPTNVGLEIARKGWPLIGVCGAMASTAWLPAEYPSLGVVVLVAEVALGIYGIARLILQDNRYK
jgi:hypothetical protein